MKTIFLVRHAESEANAAGLMAGTFDTPLTPKGKRQAKIAGKNLNGKKIELIVCSPLTRTRQTAAAVAAEIGYDADKIKLDPLLIERNYGPYEGRPFTEYLEHQQKGKLQDGIETNEQLFERVQKLMSKIKRMPEKRILLVSHGSTGRMIKLVVQNLEHSHFHTIDRIGNAEVIEFDLDD